MTRAWRLLYLPTLLLLGCAFMASPGCVRPRCINDATCPAQLPVCGADSICRAVTAEQDDDTPDAGPGARSCEDDTTCPSETPTCSLGICKRPCASDDACIDPSTFCNAVTQYCEPGCRDSSSCTDGAVCSAGTCIESTGCATKCDCAVGQVCRDGACQAPPATCLSIDDCGKAPGDQCEDFQCNGFTQLCFDPDPEPCDTTQDCVGRPGCTGADVCACTGNRQCVPSVACTASDEDTTCGAGNFCDGNGTCQPLPSCTTDTDCTNDGFVCDVAISQCHRTQACTSDSQCDMEWYCAITNGNGQCAVGCRNNASCEQGQVCNGSRTCVASGGDGGGLGGFGASCTADAECQAGLTCGTISGTCVETCDVPGTSCSGGDCCLISGAGCCNDVAYVFSLCGDCP